MRDMCVVFTSYVYITPMIFTGYACGMCVWYTGYVCAMLRTHNGEFTPALVCRERCSFYIEDTGTTGATSSEPRHNISQKTRECVAHVLPYLPYFLGQNTVQEKGASERAEHYIHNTLQNTLQNALQNELL